MSELLEAKKQLYHLLLKKSYKGLKNNEVEIMYQLSLDWEIQNFLSSQEKKEG